MIPLKYSLPLSVIFSCVPFLFDCSLARWRLCAADKGQFKNAAIGECSCVAVPGARGNHTYLNISDILGRRLVCICFNSRRRLPSDPSVGSMLKVSGDRAGARITTHARMYDLLRISIQVGGDVSSNIHNIKSRKSCRIKVCCFGDYRQLNSTIHVFFANLDDWIMGFLS